MKRQLLIFRMTFVLFVLLVGSASAYSHDHVLKFQWRFIGSTPSIDYLNRIQVYFDGNPGSMSNPIQQSDLGEMFVYVPENAKKVKFVCYAYYDGKWETYNLENRYSFDADFEFSYATDVAIVLVNFDLEAKQVVGTVQNEKGEEMNVEANRLLTNNAAIFTINWDFSKSTNPSKLPTRFMVYVDNELFCFSDPGREDVGGKIVCYIPKGKHRITVVNEYFEKGFWLENIHENNKRDFDGLADKEITVKDPFFLELHFGDLNEGSIIKWK